ncbi:unnamed protein product [Arctia plantaginis]|uniref:Uncharacterized protein n=1 Tax=Arctia plantaginis TaxID=874455 RepID=A0A8S1A931_ARCPL|nr:unnamed protein product [Arctia plantaginis]
MKGFVIIIIALFNIVFGDQATVKETIEEEDLRCGHGNQDADNHLLSSITRRPCFIPQQRIGPQKKPESEEYSPPIIMTQVPTKEKHTNVYKLYMIDILFKALMEDRERVQSLNH